MTTTLEDSTRPAAAGLQKLWAFLEMIKVSHTVFALPFAVGAAFLAAEGLPPGSVLLKIVLAVLCARTAAMSFNRVVDRRFDGANPRTQNRALVTGSLSVPFVLLSILISLTAFVLVAAWLNPLALKLSPVAIFVILSYSLTKRFTRYCHMVLGIALAIAPLGAWVAVRGTLTWNPVILGSAVFLWTSGFDIIYSCMDAQYDRSAGLRSMPVALGVQNALRLAALLHGGMWIALLLLGLNHPSLGGLYLSALVAIAALLGYQHRIVSHRDLTRVNRSFFSTNAIISFTLMVIVILEVTLP